MRKFPPDGFLIAIIAAAVMATFLPATQTMALVLDWAVKVAIFVLFFLYGARLSTKEALQGLRHWRLHLIILAFTFVVFPLIGLGLGALSPGLLSPELYAGLLFATLVPSTVQSSIAFTSIARGNVPGAIVSASASNLIGVFVTPALVIGLMATTGRAEVSASSFLGILVQLLLPFLLGQISRPLTATWVNAHKKPLSYVDRGSIVLVVYSAFSEGVQEHMWSMTTPMQLVVLVAVCCALVAFMLGLTWFVARRLGFSRDDVIAIQFCGTKKSLATGVPMAQVLFVGSPVGLLVLPLMIFHQLQLLACSMLAGRYAKDSQDGSAAGDPPG